MRGIPGDGWRKAGDWKPVIHASHACINTSEKDARPEDENVRAVRKVFDDFGNLSVTYVTLSLKRYTPGTRRVHAGTAYAAAQPLPRSQTFYAGRQATLSLCLALPMPLGVGLACSGEFRSSPLYYSLPLTLFSTTFRIRRGNTDGISLEGTTRSDEHLRVRDCGHSSTSIYSPRYSTRKRQ